MICIPFSIFIANTIFTALVGAALTHRILNSGFTQLLFLDNMNDYRDHLFVTTVWSFMTFLCTLIWPIGAFLVILFWLRVRSDKEA